MGFWYQIRDQNTTPAFLKEMNMMKDASFNVGAVKASCMQNLCHGRKNAMKMTLPPFCILLHIFCLAVLQSNGTF